jgi:rubredoxin
MYIPWTYDSASPPLFHLFLGGGGEGGKKIKEKAEKRYCPVNESSKKLYKRIKKNVN